ncbi:MAG: hypothetical protein MH204_02145, partial [Fimbriimonadaceae bacterium]|nr:hypothetical protein [Fimbriimonadaceae bacterium]
KLAENSAGSTKEIAGLISNVQSGIQEAAASMSMSMSEMLDAEQVSLEGAKTLAEISREAGQTAKLNDGLTDAVQAFANVSEQARRLLETITEQNQSTGAEMNAFTENMLANVEQLINGVAEMESQVHDLDQATGQAMEALARAKGQRSSGRGRKAA